MDILIYLKLESSISRHHTRMNVYRSGHGSLVDMYALANPQAHGGQLEMSLNSCIRLHFRFFKEGSK